QTRDGASHRAHPHSKDGWLDNHEGVPAMGGHLILSVAIGEMAFASDVRQRNLLLRAAHSELCCWCGARVLLQLRGRLGRRSRGLQVAARRAANHAHAAAEPDGLALLGDEVVRAHAGEAREGGELEDGRRLRLRPAAVRAERTGVVQPPRLGRPGPLSRRAGGGAHPAQSRAAGHGVGPGRAAARLVAAHPAPGRPPGESEGVLRLLGGGGGGGGHEAQEVRRQHLLPRQLRRAAMARRPHADVSGGVLAGGGPFPHASARGNDGRLWER
ncbi:hypothetical protein EMIHUDRAFT_357228, partial [Emiliania huxleyi CCMP1516]|uniref:Uncharacterized protein n=2 Tax=Emiliania huxleyi TaxID=2903 RepID=A0A0D3IMV6_EMIH1